MYELNDKENYSPPNQDNDTHINVKFTQFRDEDNDNSVKRKGSKKSKNKNKEEDTKYDYISKKSDENEYFGNKNMNKIIIDDEEEYSDKINFKTAFSYFSRCDYKEEQEMIDNEMKLNPKKKSFIKKICECFYGGLPLKIKLQKNLICCMTKVAYDDSIDMHYKILSTIYLFFTKEKECPKTGKHWEKIGFQSLTPKSDLRSVGMVAALQMLFFICGYPSFSYTVYKFFLEKNCEWLFAVTAINITQICYITLRDEYLDKFCVKKDDAIWIFNEFYVGIFYNLNQYLMENNEELTAEFISQCLEKIRKRCTSSSEIDALLWNTKKAT